MDALFLSRLQFAITIAFHYIFPPLSIGLGLILVIMEGLYLKTGKLIYHTMTRFWVKVFALTFAIGAATGIVMEFEFGTNWSTYSRYVGDVFGSALAAEGIFAFFLESGFLAILLFGWDKVGKKLHFLSTICVALGAHFSAIWIVVANSWMQTPAGFHIVGQGMTARAEITDFWAMVFNPSSVDRVIHVYMGAWQAGAWLVVSVSSYYLLKKRHIEFAKRSLTIALIVAALSSVGQLTTGHSSGVGVAKNQPVKLAAFEGHYENNAPAAMYLLGWVDEKNQKTIGIAIPGMLSFIIHGNGTTPIPGLHAFPEDRRPPINIVFQAYHGMVIIGMGLIGLSFLGLILLGGERLYKTTWLLKIFVISVLGPQIANQLGWIAAEVGRQPWIVYNLLRTADAFSKSVKPEEILISLGLFISIYALLFILFIYLLDQKIKHGPEEYLTGTHRTEI
ncbi:MAG: cytochrome ubiquinol oxidase subunit I [Candidatus Omnitrophica bacterium CG1_02_46_14]|nr:MAG: cytochrome ubiquinol oxidase subunit I [Candidatus Omnitrophica bacterium CG1_02_46_14]